MNSQRPHFDPGTLQTLDVVFQGTLALADAPVGICTVLRSEHLHFCFNKHETCEGLETLRRVTFSLLSNLTIMEVVEFK